MTKQTSPSISKYQAAILTEMGITLWKRADSDTSADNMTLSDPLPEKESQGSNPSVGSTEQRSQMVDRVAALKASIGRPAAKAESQSEEKQAKPTVTRTPEYMSVPDTVILAMKKGSIPESFVRDVMQAMGLIDKTIEWIPAEQVHLYRDYALSWQWGKACAVSERQLVAPDDLMASGALKKQLWQLIWQQNA